MTDCFEMSILFVSAVTCPALQTPPNGIRKDCTGTTTEYYNTVCLFSCNAGFNAVGSLSRKCLQNGTWSGQDFLCQGEITRQVYFAELRAPKTERRTSNGLFAFGQYHSCLLAVNF